MIFNKQLEACRSLISTLETKYPESDFPCLMRASLLHREKHSDKAVELLKVCVVLVLFINILKSFHFKFTVQYQGSPNYLMCSVQTFFWQTVEVLFWKDCVTAKPACRLLLEKWKTCTVFLSSCRNTNGSLGEGEMLWEHDQQASVSTVFLSSPKLS